MVTNQRLIEQFRQHQCLEGKINFILWKTNYVSRGKYWIYINSSKKHFTRCNLAPKENMSVFSWCLHSPLTLIKLIKYWLAQLDHFQNGHK